MGQLSWESALLGAAVATAVQPLLVRGLRAKQVLDVPNERSSHATPTPRGGGWGIVLAVVVVAVVGISARGYEFSGLAATGCLAAAVVGGIDDIKGLPATLRLIPQVGIGVLVAMGAAGVPSTPAELLLDAFVAIAVVAYVNAFNFMDGINGISAISGAMAAVWLAVLAVREGEPALGWLAAGVAGSCLGFLPWNFPTARLFLGDVGSYFLGAVLAALAVSVWQSGGSFVLCVAPFVPYLFDTGLTLVRRAVRGERLAQAHREHLYQRLSARSGHVVSTAVVAVVTAGCLGAAVIVERVGWVPGVVVGCGVCGLYWFASRGDAWHALPRAPGKAPAPRPKEGEVPR